MGLHACVAPSSASSSTDNWILYIPNIKYQYSEANRQLPRLLTVNRNVKHTQGYVDPGFETGRCTKCAQKRAKKFSGY